MSKPSLLVTFDSMRDPNCGYYFFGKGLGDALLQANQGKFDMQFYLFNKTGYFDGRVGIKRRRPVPDEFLMGRFNKFSLVHITDQRARLRPDRLATKKIMTIHDINKVHVKKSKPHRIEAFLQRLRRKIAACDRVVAISQFVADDVLKYVPEARDKMRVIYNGADRLAVPVGSQPVYTPKKPFLFTIGLMSPQKGFHHLPALLQGNDYELVISGIETPHKQRILEAAEQFGCTGRVTITGPIADSDKAWYYKNCSALLFPSIAEGFGLPVIEAMHFGKPAFLARATSLPEIGGSLAYYFDNFEPGHMQAVFAAGMLDHQENNRADSIIAHANTFSWEACAAQYMALYQEVLGG